MLLEAEGIKSGYGKLTVLHGISLQAKAGAITSVLGPNGAGKSTLMKTLAGHLPMGSGSLVLDNRDLTRCGPLERTMAGIGHVAQQHNVFGELSVRDNLHAAAAAFDGGRARIEDVLSRFPIFRERASQRANTLSGGERQTLAIALALVGAPRILLLDEPTAGLAPIFVNRILAWVCELVDAGMGVLWVVEQDPEKILKVSERTYVIEAGNVADCVESSELLKPGRIETVVFR